MFEKMAQSLAATGQFEVHIIGYPAQKEHSYPDIYFHPSRQFRRLSLYRLLIPFLTLAKTWKLTPSAVIVTTHELLVFATLLKLTRPCKIIYDVQENYLRNILFLSTFPLVVRPFLALYVRMKEIITAPFISLFILSDIGYRNELTFMKKKCIVIENKVKRSAVRKAQSLQPNAPNIRLLFSGTLAKSTGVFIAIELAKSLHELDPRFILEIIGYCPQPDVLHRIKMAIEGYDFIRLTGGDHLVPHEKIMETIGKSHFGIISYPPNPSTENTLPTKLFEYIGSQLPILIVNYSYWLDQCEPYPAAVTFDPHAFDAGSLLQKMLSTMFYLKPPHSSVYWESEAEKFLTCITLL
jgi:hypothetical protein